MSNILRLWRKKSIERRVRESLQRLYAQQELIHEHISEVVDMTKKRTVQDYFDMALIEAEQQAQEFIETNHPKTHDAIRGWVLDCGLTVEQIEGHIEAIYSSTSPNVRHKIRLAASGFVRERDS